MLYARLQSIMDGMKYLLDRRIRSQEVSDFADVLSDKPFKSVSIFFSQLTSEQGNITWSPKSTPRTNQLIFRKCFGIQLCTKHH